MTLLFTTEAPNQKKPLSGPYSPRLLKEHLSRVHAPINPQAPMDPSVVKLLEEDEDESMHSGADVEAFTAALNSDIGGNASSIAQPSDPNTGVLFQGSCSLSKQLQCHTSSQEENLSPQIQQERHMQSSDQHLSQMELIQQRSGSENQYQRIDILPEHGQMLVLHEQSHPDQQQQQTETNALEFVEKNQVKSCEQNPAQRSKQDRDQHPESQQKHAVEQLNSQKAPAANQANNSMRPMEFVPNNNEVSKMDFIRVIKNIVGDQMYKQAVQKLHMQFQAQTARNLQTNPNQHSLQTQASSCQLSSCSTQKFAEPQTFTPLLPMSLSDNQKGHKLPPHQPVVAASKVQMQADTIFSTRENINQKSRQNENRSDGKVVYPAQISSTNMNGVNPENEISMSSLQAVNKQQQHAQLPQTSFPMIGSPVSNFHAHSYPRPSVSVATTSTKLQNQESQLRQIPLNQGTMSTQFGATQPMMTVMCIPKSELQITANETTKLHGRFLSHLTSHSASQQNPGKWQPSPNNQQSSTFPSMTCVKQEVADQAAEPQHKPQFTTTQGSEFRSVHTNKGDPTFGSLKDETMERQSSKMGWSTCLSMMATSQISGRVANQVDPTLQDETIERQSSKMGFSTSVSMIATSQISGPVANQVDPILQISCASLPLLAGTNSRTPPMKPSVGQKRPLEALGTSSPLLSKKQKTGGASLDQSIEQLNDVTAVSGVNLREEEERLFSAPKQESRASEATRRVVQDEEESLILQKAPLREKLAGIMSKFGLKSIRSDVERCLSMCVEERLQGLISNLIRLSRQRVDIEKMCHQIFFTSDIQRQILVMNRKAKDEWEKKQAEIAKKLRKLNEMEGNTVACADKDKDEGRSRALKANKEDDKMRATAANVAARAAVGGDDMLSKWQLMAEQARQKREGGVNWAPGSQSGKTASVNPLSYCRGTISGQQETGDKRPSAASSSGGMRKLGRSPVVMPYPKVACKISIKDVISVLEREPQMSKSTLIYRLYERGLGTLQHS